MVEVKVGAMSFHQECVLLKIMISNVGQIQWPYMLTSPWKYYKFILNVHQFATPTNKTTSTCWSFFYQIEGKQISVWLYWCFSLLIKRGYWWTYSNNICQRYHWHENKRWLQIEGVPPLSHLKVPVLCTVMLWVWIRFHNKI